MSKSRFIIDDVDDFVDLEQPPSLVLPTTILPLIHKATPQKESNWYGVHSEQFAIHKHANRYIVLGIIVMVTWFLL